MHRYSSVLTPSAEAVLCVARTLSFSAAARELGVVQSTISRRVRELEDHLGVSLFERYADGVRPTEAGRAFLGTLVRSEALLAEAMREARQAGTADVGTLRIGFVWSFAVGAGAEVLNLFRLKHPNIRTHLTELGAAELLRMTLHRELDCAWIVPWRDLSQVLRVEPLWSEHLYLATRSGRGGPAPADWQDLGGRPFLCRQSDEWQSLQPAVDRVDGPRLDLQIHDCSRESLLLLIASGDGVTVLPESIATRGFPGVEFRALADPRATLPLSAIFRPEADNPALTRLLAIIRDWRRRRSSASAGPA